MKLTFDELAHILAVADRQTQARLMRTCRNLYEEGAKWILEDGYACIHSAAELVSFVSFMRAEEGRRIPLLHSLKISLPKPTSRAAKRLKDLFRDFAVASTLTALNVRELEDLLHANNKLAVAIAAITSLTQLYVSGIGPCALNLLRDLRSQLQTASIDMGCMREHEDSDNPHADITRILPHSHATLESLVVCEPGQIVAPVRPFPNLTNIVLMNPLPMLLSKYAPAFPALEVLHVDVCLPDDPAESVADGHLAEIRRAENTAWREAHPDEAWQTLRQFIGTVTALYALGLGERHVHTVTLAEGDPSERPGMFAAVLDDTAPCALHLAMHRSALWLDAAWVDSLCCPRRIPLRLLILTLRLGSGEYNDDRLDLASIVVSVQKG